MKSSILQIAASILLTGIATLPVSADDAKSPYSVSATAQDGHDTAAGHHSTYIKMVISKQSKQPGAEPEVVSRPSLLVEDNQWARMTVGQTRPSPSKRGKDPTDAGELFSGIRIDVIKPREQADAVVVTTIWENGNISWAQTNTVKVTKAITNETMPSK